LLAGRLDPDFESMGVASSICILGRQREVSGARKRTALQALLV
jgi:hypothetical protein